MLLKIGDISEDLINEIQQMFCSLYLLKDNSKNLYNDIVNYRIDKIFKGLKKRKKSDPHRLILNLDGKRDIKRNNKYVKLSNIIIYDTWKSIEDFMKKRKFRIACNME